MLQLPAGYSLSDVKYTASDFLAGGTMPQDTRRDHKDRAENQTGRYFRPNRRQVLITGAGTLTAISGVPFAAAKEIDADDEKDGDDTDETRKLMIEGSGSRAAYSFTVSGSLAEADGPGSLGGTDEISNSSATGAVRNGTDSYLFDGEITDFSLDGDARVLIDGEEVDIDELGDGDGDGDGVDDVPEDVNELFETLDDFEQLAATADAALIVDFRREGIDQLQEELGESDALAEAEDHNEKAAEAVLDGDSDELQEQLDQTTEALEEVDGDAVTDLIDAQESPLEIIFGGEVKLPGEIIINVPSSVILAERVLEPGDDSLISVNLTKISRMIENPETSRKVVLQTEEHLTQAKEAISTLQDDGYTLSLDDPSTLTVSNDDNYSTSLDLAAWLWASGYGVARGLINVVLVGIGAGRLFSVLHPGSIAERELLQELRSVIINIAPSELRGLLRDRLPEGSGIRVSGRLDDLIPLGLGLTYLLRQEFDSVDEFVGELGISDEEPAEDLEDVLTDLAALEQTVLELEALTLPDIDENLLTDPIEDLSEAVNNLIEDEIGVDIAERTEDIGEFARTLLLKVLDLGPVDDLLSEEVSDYLEGVLEGSEEVNEAVRWMNSRINKARLSRLYR